MPPQPVGCEHAFARHARAVEHRVIAASPVVDPFINVQPPLFHPSG